MDSYVQKMHPMDRMTMYRFYLEGQFPTLAFHFYKKAEMYPDCTLVCVVLRSDKTKWHEEVADPDTFPTPDFLARCALIA